MRTEASKLTTSRYGRPVAVTHVAQSETCPLGCPWNSRGSVVIRMPDGSEIRGGGCYAQTGPEGRVTRRLEASLVGGSGADLAGSGGSADARGLWVALEEARRIWGAAARTLTEGRGEISGVPLRLHVTGETPGGPGAVVLGRACRGWISAGGGPVWTYTHRWREVDRRAWGPISVLASCETLQDAAEAASRGYAVALVTTDGIEALRASWGRTEGTKAGAAFECPQQKGEGTPGKRADCASCGACWRLSAGALLALRPHGPGGRVPLRMRGLVEAFSVASSAWAGSSASGDVGELSGAVGASEGQPAGGAGVLR